MHTILGGALFLVLTSGFMAGGVLAQTPPSPEASASPSLKWILYPDGKLHPQAPVGHRQPRLADLPPDLARREKLDQPTLPSDAEEENARDSAIDQPLRICRGC
jgi:hypothetical protein